MKKKLLLIFIGLLIFSIGYLIPKQGFQPGSIPWWVENFFSECGLYIIAITLIYFPVRAFKIKDKNIWNIFSFILGLVICFTLSIYLYKEGVDVLLELRNYQTEKNKLVMDVDTTGKTLKDKHIITKLKAREQFIFDDKIVDFLDEDGNIIPFKPDSSDLAIIKGFEAGRIAIPWRIKSMKVAALIWLILPFVVIIAGLLIPSKSNYREINSLEQKDKHSK